MSSTYVHDLEFRLPRGNGERRHRVASAPPYITNDGLVVVDLRESPRRRDDAAGAPEPAPNSKPLLPAKEGN
ncbi:hypothetical protein JHS3_31710 [Jeongeupia sp. HS-3]|uniref:hypothetical protein n=1 Tax=Jeongeupia sp. HS-3 TaxID=1009682 RepID=UPI0018A64A7D|nr:hypothetical protein [Jeongeupia sp. HS-3]BCL77435.1 hypothetical protein JHS3_31710 [Jeongeupia sp. HS-3]